MPANRRPVYEPVMRVNDDDAIIRGENHDELSISVCDSLNRVCE